VSTGLQDRPSVRGPVRPDALAYPSTFGARYLLFLVALLAVGAFLGNYLHNQVRFTAWMQDTQRCWALAEEASADLPFEQAFLTHQEVLTACNEAAERPRAAFQLAGVVVVGVLSAGLLFVIPPVLERRRRLRRPAPKLDGLVARVGELAAEEGVGRVPQVMLRHEDRADAFCYGVPGRYRLVIPAALALRWQDPTLFDPIVRHELAHLRRGDVMLAWLARTVWYVLAPLLALPIVVGLVRGDPSLFPAYLWRVALVAVTVGLVSRALLRAREHEADLRSTSRPGRPEALASSLTRFAGSPRSETERLASWRRWLATHPTPQERCAVLERPELATQVGFLDGFVAAFLVAMMFPQAQSTLQVALSAVGRSGGAHQLTAAAAGLLLSAAVGLGLWRASLVGRLVGTPVRPWPAALGVGLGLIVGQSASFGQIGSERVFGLDHPLWVLGIVALLGVGSTTLSAGLGELSADAAAAARSARRAWVPALAVNAALFTAVVLVVLQVQLGSDAGWGLVREWLVTAVASRPILTAAAAVALAAAWAIVAARRAHGVTVWLTETSTEAAWPTGTRVRLSLPLTTGVVGGLIGAASVAALRLLSGPATDEAAATTQYYTGVWITAAVGVSVALGLAVTVVRRGIALGVLAGPIAVVTTVAGSLVFDLITGGQVGLLGVAIHLRTTVALGFVLMLVMAASALFTWDGAEPPASTALSTAVGRVAVITVLGIVVVLLGRDVVVGTWEMGEEGLLSEAFLDPSGDQGPLVGEPVLDQVTVEYVLVTAPAMLEAWQLTAATVVAILDDPTLTDESRAAAYTAEVGPLLATLVDDVVAATPDGEAGRAHAILLAALEEARAGLESYVAWLEGGDDAHAEESDRRMNRVDALMDAYDAAVVALATGDEVVLPAGVGAATAPTGRFTDE
jgi:Zn-dependent protease with chaperone function